MEPLQAYAEWILWVLRDWSLSTGRNLQNTPSTESDSKRKGFKRKTWEYPAWNRWKGEGERAEDRLKRANPRTEKLGMSVLDNGTVLNQKRRAPQFFARHRPDSPVPSPDWCKVSKIAVISKFQFFNSKWDWFHRLCFQAARNFYKNKKRGAASLFADGSCYFLITNF